MLSLSKEERKVVVFVGAVALVGLGVGFAGKNVPVVREIIQPDEHWAKMDLNRAGMDDFRGSRFISQKLAQKIIAHRQAGGRFRDIEDLKNVKGVGDARYEKLKKIFYVQ